MLNLLGAITYYTPSEKYIDYSALFGYVLLAICFIIVFFIVIEIRKEASRLKENTESQRRDPFKSYDNLIAYPLKKTDELFNKEKFISWAKDVFINFQYAWSNRNLDSVKYLQTPDLYEQTLDKIEKYIANNQINKIEKISIENIKLYKFEKKESREYLSVIIKSRMLNYTINERTGYVISGNKELETTIDYVLTFSRALGSTTENSGNITKLVNCPNCGAHINVNLLGKCEYCSSIIKATDYGWLLESLKEYNIYMT